MKKNLLNPRILFLILSSIVILSSCKKDDEEDPAANLVGTWNSGDATFTAMINDKTMTQYFIDVMQSSQADAQLSTNLFYFILQQAFTGTIQFKADDTYTSTLGGDTENGTWSLSVDGTKLTRTPTGMTPMVVDVVMLTATTLKVHWVESFLDDVNEDDIDETVTATIDLTFTK